MKPKPAMMNIAKWAAKTALAVERICKSKTGIPIGFAILFLDPTAKEEEIFNFSIHLAGSPEEGMPEEDRKRLTACFEYIMIGVRRIYEKGIPEDRPQPTRTKDGQWLS